MGDGRSKNLNRRYMLGLMAGIIGGCSVKHLMGPSTAIERMQKMPDWFEAIPEKRPGHPTVHELKIRADMLIEAAAAGMLVYDWVPLNVTDRLTVFVMTDALRFGNKESSIRFAVSAKTQQRIADILGAYMLTPKLVDEVWKQSKKLNPHPQKISASKFAILKHHEALEKERDGHPGLISGWKDWCVGRTVFQRPTRAINYGWHVDTTSTSWKGIKLHSGVSAGKVIQPAAAAHGINHTDYSQLCRLVQKQAFLDGNMVDLATVVTDPAAACLISTEGVLPGMRHPGIKEKHNATFEPAPIHLLMTQLGDKGAGVVVWQQHLIDAGYRDELAPWGADGAPGPATERATQLWRSSNV